MGKNEWLGYGAAIVFLGILIAFALSNMSAAAVVAALVVAAIMASRVGLWRSMLSVSFGAAVLHAGPGADALPESAWYVVQFAPLAVSTVVLLTKPGTKVRRADRRILTALAIYCIIALVTALTGTQPSTTLAQSGILIFVSLFLGLTYTRRWVGNQALLRGDVAAVFWLVVVAQVAGIGSLLTGQVFATADYGRFQGAFSNANYVGLAAVIGLMAGMYLFATRAKGLGVPYIVGGAVIIWALVLSGSRGALIAVGAGLLALLLVRSSRRVLIPVTGLAVPVVLFMFAASPQSIKALGEFFDRTLQGSDVTSGRLGIYEILIYRWQQAPWFGSGYRTTEVLSGASGIAAHNIYLSTLVETGIVGSVVFAVLLLSILAAGPRAGAARVLIGAVIAILVGELVESTLFGFGGPTALLSWLVMLAYAASGHSTAEPGAVEELPPIRTMQALSR